MKNFIKYLLSVFCRLIAVFFYFLYRLEKQYLSNRRVFVGYSQFFSLFPGLFGEYLRREFYRLTLRSCSSDCCISFGTVFSTDDVEIGPGVYLGNYCVIGRASIGANTLLASRVSVISGFRQHGMRRVDLPMKEQAGEFSRVTLGEDCWIGEGAIVGADIGAHSVIAAGGVVVKEVESGVIVGGNPAKFIKSRDSQTLNQM